MSFSNLKSKRSSISELVQASEKLSERKSYEDDRFWKPTLDKAGNGYAVIRFLPAPDGEDLPWVRYWDHGFKGPTGLWYIENSLTSIDKPDPLSEMNGVLWNSGKESDKEIARSRKRRLHYVSNIYIVSDPGNPSNDGKVFLFKYGKKIFDKIMEVMQPQFQDEVAVNPFDFWEGCDFKLKIRKVEGYQNYDKSEFSKQSALLNGNDSKLESIYNNLYKLNDFLDPKNFKTYDELKEKLNKVLGNSSASRTLASNVSLDESEAPPAFKESIDKPMPSSQMNKFDDDDDDSQDETLSYFAKLAASN